MDIPDVGLGAWRGGLKANGNLAGRLVKAGDGNLYTQHPDTGEFLQATPISNGTETPQ